MTSTKTKATQEEKQLLQVAYSFLAETLPHCAIDLQNAKPFKTEIIGWTDFERLYNAIKRPVPKIIDTTTSQPVDTKHAVEKPTCTFSALHHDRELTEKEKRSRLMKVTFVAGWNDWYDEAMEWINQKPKELEAGKIRATIDEVLAPAVLFLGKFVTSKIGTPSPISISEFNSEASLSRIFIERNISIPSRFRWTQDLLSAIELELEKVGLTVKPSRRKQFTKYEIVKTIDGKYFAVCKQRKEKREYKISGRTNDQIILQLMLELCNDARMNPEQYINSLGLFIEESSLCASLGYETDDTESLGRTIRRLNERWRKTSEEHDTNVLLYDRKNKLVKLQCAFLEQEEWTNNNEVDISEYSEILSDNGELRPSRRENLEE